MVDGDPVAQATQQLSDHGYKVEREGETHQKKKEQAVAQAPKEPTRRNERLKGHDHGQDC